MTVEPRSDSSDFGVRTTEDEEKDEDGGRGFYGVFSVAQEIRAGRELEGEE